MDKYYDIYEHSLMKEDHWLRQRNGDWELKYPVGDVHSQVRKKSTDTEKNTRIKLSINFTFL